MSDLVGTPENPDIIDHLRYGLGNVEFGDSKIELGGLKGIMNDAIVEIETLRIALDESYGGVCRCGLPMSRNPHPNAGKLEHLLEVGAMWVCIPCQSGTLHRWADRALNAEKKLHQMEADK